MKINELFSTLGHYTIHVLQTILFDQSNKTCSAPIWSPWIFWLSRTQWGFLLFCSNVLWHWKSYSVCCNKTESFLRTQLQSSISAAYKLTRQKCTANPETPETRECCMDLFKVPVMGSSYFRWWWWSWFTQSFHGHRMNIDLASAQQWEWSGVEL